VPDSSDISIENDGQDIRGNAMKGNENKIKRLLPNSGKKLNFS
jgi:hypothetical protein